MTVHGSRSYY